MVAPLVARAATAAAARFASAEGTSISAKVTANQVLKNIREIQRRSKEGASYTHAMEFTARQIMAEAKRRAPYRFGELRESDFIRPRQGFGRSLSVTMGFAAQHAAVMDQGWQVEVIRPVRARALFIPLSRRASRLSSASGGRLGQLLKTRGSALKRGVDFVFAQSVRPPKPVKGRRKGPNYYFSGTIQDFASGSPSRALKGLAQGVTDTIAGSRGTRRG